MTFTSLKFYLFVPVVYSVFYFTSDRWRWLVLLVTSYWFYASFKAPYLLAVLFMVTSLSYACGLRIGSNRNEASRKRWLQIGIAVCLAILALLKYLPFLEAQSNSIFGLSSTLSKTIISIGVSYFTFQAISYLTDIYLETEEPEEHFGHFALYLAFFPKLLQGPIERASDLLPQLKNKYKFDYDNMRFGMLLFTWGLFKKVVIADRLGLYVDAVYKDVHAFTGLPLLLATYAYAFQIYLDFSGYTDMALGSARLFNINLTQNFNSPYLATSVADFWRRWHITFSRWILDYIFKPLQMQWRNWKNWGTASALVVAFIISGIWHGATWEFVIWGGLHGLYMACSVFYKPYQKKLHKALGIEKTRILKYWQIFVTFNLVSFAWVFFRATSLKDAVYVITNIFSGEKGLRSRFLLLQGQYELLALIVATFLFMLMCISLRKHSVILAFNRFATIRHIAYFLFIMFIILVGEYAIDAKFLYSNF